LKKLAGLVPFFTMGFTDAQRNILTMAWKKGYLSDTKNYGLISKITRLSRKQISNWARTQIRKLEDEGAPLPRRCGTNDAPGQFTQDCKNFLEIAWNYGLLPGVENYGLIQDFTNLSRKQISNWSRARVRQAELESSMKLRAAPLLYPTATQGFSGAGYSLAALQQASALAAAQAAQAAVPQLPPAPQTRPLTPVPTNASLKPRAQQTAPHVKSWILDNALLGIQDMTPKKIKSLSALVGLSEQAVKDYLGSKGWKAVKKEGSAPEHAIPPPPNPTASPPASDSSEPPAKRRRIEQKGELPPNGSPLPNSKPSSIPPPPPATCSPLIPTTNQALNTLRPAPRTEAKSSSPSSHVGVKQEYQEKSPPPKPVPTPVPLPSPTFTPQTSPKFSGGMNTSLNLTPVASG